MKKKNVNKISKRERNDQLTNWYLVNLCWGIIGFLALILVKKGYSSGDTIAFMQPMMWVLTVVFALATITLFLIGKKIINGRRALNYSAFMSICTVVSLWLALYNKIRPIIEKIAQSVLGNPALSISSFWNVWIPMIAIGVYLIIAFIWFAIKVTRK